LLPTDVVAYHVQRKLFQRKVDATTPFMAMTSEYLGFDQFLRGVVWVPFGHSWMVSFACRRDAERFTLLAMNDEVVMSVNGVLI
jgi:hypothetical protein